MRIVVYSPSDNKEELDKISNALNQLETAITLDGDKLELILTSDELSEVDAEATFGSTESDRTLVRVPHINFSLGIRHVASKIASIIELKSIDNTFVKTIKEIQHVDFTSFKKAIDQCIENGVVCFDFETTGLEFYAGDVPTMLIFSDRPGISHYIVLDREGGVGTAVTKKVCRYLYDHVLMNKEVIKIGQNLKFDITFVRSVIGERVRPVGTLYDTQILSHLINENNRQHNLDSLVLRHEPGYAGFKKAMKNVDWATVPLSDLVPYACKDVHTTLLISATLVAEMVKDQRLVDYYHNLSMPLIYLLADMAFNGVDIDSDMIKEEVRKKEKDIADMEGELLNHPSMQWYLSQKLEIQKKEEREEIELRMLKHKEGSVQYKKYQSRLEQLDDMQVSFNLNSNDQVADFLNAIGVKVKNVDKHTLADHDHPWISLWQAYKQVSKMVSTYYVGILNHSHQNKLYGSFLQTGTVTHRLSSMNPNMQNLPVRSRISEPRAQDALKKVKSFFSVDKGWTFVGADMSQAELRTIANVSGDRTMQNVYLSGMDIHTLTASSITGMSYENFLALKTTDPKTFADHRFGAKGANFGMVYRISAASYIVYLKQQYGIEIDSETEAVHRNSIFGTYKELKKWHNTYVNKAKAFKQVRSLFGTCRRLPDIDSDEGFKRSSAEREAINAPIQETSVQYCLLSMVLINEIAAGLPIYLQLQIHDAVYGKVKDGYVDFTYELFNACFSEPPIELFGIDKKRMVVPMAIDFEVGQSWALLKPYVV